MTETKAPKEADKKAEAIDVDENPEPDSKSQPPKDGDLNPEQGKE